MRGEILHSIPRALHNYYSPLNSLAIVIKLTHTTCLKSCADIIHKQQNSVSKRVQPRFTVDTLRNKFVAVFRHLNQCFWKVMKSLV